MEILDLGGGYPSGELSDQIIDALQETRNDPLGYEVVAEPGRHFSSQSCYLLTRVLAKRMKHNKTCYHINDSLYHSFNCVLMDGVSFENDFDQVYAAITNNSLEKVSDEKDMSIIPTSIFGMTCDGADVIAKNTGLPEKLSVGDWLCYSGMGSYTYGPKSGFNGMHSTTRVFEWNAPIEQQTEAPASSSEEQKSGPSVTWNPSIVQPAF